MPVATPACAAEAVAAIAGSADGAGIDDAMTLGATSSAGTANAIVTWETAGETCAALFVSGLAAEDTEDASPRDSRDSADLAAGVLSAGVAAGAVDRRCGVEERWTPAV
jgi:hypothetical protein